MLISTKGIQLLSLTLFFEILETSLENLETIHFPILVFIKSYTIVLEVSKSIQQKNYAGMINDLINTRCRS